MLRLVLFVTLTTCVFSNTIGRHTNNPRFQVSECEPDAPCDFNSTNLEPLDPAIAREIVFGEITAEFISSYAVEFANVQATAGVGGDWVNIGITSPTAEGQVTAKADSYIESGRIRNIYQSSTDVNTLYVLTSGGGLWKTKNLFDPSGFPTWTPLSDNLLSTCGGSFALGRSSDTIYLGLGDPILYFGTRNAPGCIGGMMYISQDGGLTWGLPSYFTFEVEGAVYTATIIFDVQVEHSQSPDVVLVSTEIGIFRSIDGGASFSHVYPTRNVTNIVLGRQTPTFSLAQSLVRTSVGWMSFDYLPSVRQLILSENGGQNWSTPVESNWGLVTGSDSGVALGRTTLAVGTPGENVVYAVVGLVNAPNPSLTSRATEQLNVFKSTDGGILWESLRCNSSYTPTNPVANVQINLGVLGPQAWYAQLLLVDSSDPTRNTVYLGGQLSSVKTSDGGQTWSVISTWVQGFAPTLSYVHADFHTASMVTTPFNTSAIIFGTDGGLFASTNGGQFWFHGLNKGLTASLINFLSGSPLPHMKGILAAGLQDEGTKLRTGSSSLLWNNVRGGDGDGCAFNQVPTEFSSLNLLVTSIYNNQFSCLNATNSGKADLFNSFCNAGINQSDTLFFFTNLVAPTAGSDPTGFVFYTYTGERVYQSEFSPTRILQWESVGTNGVSSGLSDSLFRLALHGIGVGTMSQIAVCKQDTVALTVDGGATWFEPNITYWFPSWNYTTSPLWVTVEGALLLFVSSESVESTVPRPGVVPSPRVIFTADLGVSWSSVSEGLPNMPVSKLVSYGGRIYAASWLGVFMNDLTVAPWRKLGGKVPSASMTDLYISSNLLYVGSFGRGAWQFDTNTIPPVDGSSTPTTLPVSGRPSSRPVSGPTSSGSSSSNSSLLSDGAIAGIVIGCVVFAMCVAGLFALLVFGGKSPSAVDGASDSNTPASPSISAVNPEAGLNSSFSIGEDAP